MESVWIPLRERGGARAPRGRGAAARATARHSPRAEVDAPLAMAATMRALRVQASAATALPQQVRERARGAAPRRGATSFAQACSGFWERPQHARARPGAASPRRPLRGGRPCHLSLVLPAIALFDPRPTPGTASPAPSGHRSLARLLARALGGADLCPR